MPDTQARYLHVERTNRKSTSAGEKSRGRGEQGNRGTGEMGKGEWVRGKAKDLRRSALPASFSLFPCSPIPLFPCSPIPPFPCSPIPLFPCSPAYFTFCAKPYGCQIFYAVNSRRSRGDFPVFSFAAPCEKPDCVNAESPKESRSDAKGNALLGTARLNSELAQGNILSKRNQVRPREG